MLHTTEEHLKEIFNKVVGGEKDSIERVKKIKDYAFVHFKDRYEASLALEKVNSLVCIYNVHTYLRLFNLYFLRHKN